MFKSPFSFEGRIRRKEYLITLTILDALCYILAFVDRDGIEDVFLVMYLIVFIAIIWINLAQTTKRCHDINRSGWYQLIPFYTIYLLFAEGDRRRNIYGPDPKVRRDDMGILKGE